jgi:hypothetical protein
MYMNSKNAQSKELVRKNNVPNVNSLLKISLGLVFFTIVASVMVYADSVPVDVDGTSFDFTYSGTGVTVNSVSSDLDFVSLLVSVDVTESDAVLEITLDRSFFDSVSDNGDEPFMVLVDGDDLAFTQISTSDVSRTLSIGLPTGTEEIEIFGTIFAKPVPELFEEVEVIEEPEVTMDETEQVTDVQDSEIEIVEESIEETSTLSTEENTQEIIKTPSVQCGPGTLLIDGECVLDERCGPGTMMVDGICEVVESQEAETVRPGMGKEFVTGIIAAFVLAGIVGIILGIIAKGSRKKN